jgi:hypothetical protein
VRTTILGSALLLPIALVMVQAQTTSKPESGLISSTKYTNVFFGFSLPLPQDAHLQLLANSNTREPFRHVLFGANSTQKGYPVIVIFADEITESGNAEPRKTVLSLGAKAVDTIQLGGKEFSSGKWRADGIYRVANATALRGYVLCISVFSDEKKILDEFERSIQELTFFDPARAREQAGADSRPYEGPPPPSTPASNQQSVKPDSLPFPATQVAPKPDDVSVAKPGMFYDKELDLHFNYPVEMRALDAATDMEIGHRNIFGVSGENDPEHQEAKRCMRVLLDADLEPEKAPQRNADIGNLWVDDLKESKESRRPEPIYAKLLMVELAGDCVPEKLRKKENDVLGSMALSAVSIPGVQRMPKPIWYEIGKQKIHMNSGIGRPVVNGQVASAPIIVMAMSTQWRGHLLGWMFVSNDTEIFNGITKSLVQFGDGRWGPMFVANIGPPGSGTPLTILPK